MTEKDLKSCLSIKKLIFTSKRHAEHPFIGQNTQNMPFYLNYFKSFQFSLKITYCPFKCIDSILNFSCKIIRITFLISVKRYLIAEGVSLLCDLVGTSLLSSHFQPIWLKRIQYDNFCGELLCYLCRWLLKSRQNWLSAK